MTDLGPLTGALDNTWPSLLLPTALSDGWIPRGSLVAHVIPYKRQGRKVLPRK